MHPEPAMIEGDLAADPGPIRLVRLRLTLALIAMAFVPIAVAAPILSTALDGQRAAEQAQVDRDAAGVASVLDARLASGLHDPREDRAPRARWPAMRPGPRAPSPGAKAALAVAVGRRRRRDGRGDPARRARAPAHPGGRRQDREDRRRRVRRSARRGRAVGRAWRDRDRRRRARRRTATAHLALATPVMGTGRVGERRSGSSGSSCRSTGSSSWPAPSSSSGGTARLVDRVRGDGRAGGRRGPPAGATDLGGQHAPLARRLVDPARRADHGWRRPRCRSSACSRLFVTLLAVLIIWMARQVLRPAEELEASRGRLRDMYELARVDSLRDVITGLGNHRAFQEAFERQVDAARTRQASVGLVLIDLDDFQAVNDGGGHAAGDEALAAFGRLIQATLRPTDRAFRTGGDEFALLLPGRHRRSRRGRRPSPARQRRWRSGPGAASRRRARSPPASRPSRRWPPTAASSWTRPTPP